MSNYKVLTLKIGSGELNDITSREISRQAKQGFIVSQSSVATNENGEYIAHYLLTQVPVSHLSNNLIDLGGELHYWKPCGDSDDIDRIVGQ